MSTFENIYPKMISTDGETQPRAQSTKMSVPTTASV